MDDPVAVKTRASVVAIFTISFIRRETNGLASEVTTELEHRCSCTVNPIVREVVTPADPRQLTDVVDCHAVDSQALSLILARVVISNVGKLKANPWIVMLALPVDS